MDPHAKATLRRQAIARRDALPNAARREAALSIATHVTAHPAWSAARTVAAYVPIGSEVDTRPLLEAGLREGKRVAVPRTDVRAHRITFHLVHDLKELREGAFRVPEPDPLRHEDVPPHTPDLVLVPGVAFDRRGHRLGYGRGYFDRYLQGHPAFKMGLAYAPLLLDRIPAEPHDIAVDAVATESGVHAVSGQAGGS